jgi:hypothetical protein
MATTDEVLIFMGAAEGSWYTAGSISKDVRYRSSFANSNSGLSFGTFQFDCATNTRGRYMLKKMLDDAVLANRREFTAHLGMEIASGRFGSFVLLESVDAAAEVRIYAAATRRNAKAYISEMDRGLVDAVLGQPSSRTLIDRADADKAAADEADMARLIADAARHWRGPWRLDIFDPNSADYLRLLAYLMATNNRHPNEKAFTSWLSGNATPTYSGPNGGYQLKGPPTIEDLHRFLNSMKMWSSGQGSYIELRNRMEPALERILARRAQASAGAGGSWSQTLPQNLY